MRKGDRIVMKSTSAGPGGVHAQDLEYVVGQGGPRGVSLEDARAFVDAGHAVEVERETATRPPEETATRGPAEDATTAPEENGAADAPEIISSGGGWFEVAGEKVQGRAAAEALRDELEGGS